MKKSVVIAWGITSVVVVYALYSEYEHFLQQRGWEARSRYIESLYDKAIDKLDPEALRELAEEIDVDAEFFEIIQDI